MEEDDKKYRIRDIMNPSCYNDEISFDESDQKEYSIRDLIPNSCYKIEYQIKTKYIIMKLTQGQKTIFDFEDFDRVIEHTWYAIYNPNTQSYYAVAHINKKIIYLSNFIMKHTPTRKLTVDHINGDTLDNRKINLYITNFTNQNLNKRPIHKNNTSGTKRIYLQKSNEKWVVDLRTKFYKETKSFSIKKYGEEAKQLAEKYMKEIEKKYITDMPNNTIYQKSIYHHKTSEKWVAQWNTQFNREQKTFSVKKYGNKKAKKLAIEAANEMEKKYMKDIPNRKTINNQINLNIDSIEIINYKQRKSIQKRQKDAK